VTSLPPWLALGTSVSIVFGSPISIAITRGAVFCVFGTAALVILGLDVRNVKESVSSNREVDESRLDGGFDIDDFSFIDVPGVTLVTGPFNVELLENAVFDDCDAAFFGLEHVDQHFFLHAVSF
jgi:hypothetical protein